MNARTSWWWAFGWIAFLFLRGAGGVSVGVAEDSGVPSSLPSRAPSRYVVGVSPFLSETSKNDVYRRLVRTLVQDLGLGRSLWVFDAYHLRTVTRFEIPDRRVFASEKTRLNQFRDGIREVRAFLAANPVRPEVEGCSFENAVRLPQFLEFVSENCRVPGEPLAVLVLGSPLYLDDKEPGFSMVHGFHPSDGHLAATRERSVYGLQGLGGRLDGVGVQLGYFGDPWANDLHRDRVIRFWRMFVGGQGGWLGAVTADLPTVFAAVLSGRAVAGVPALEAAEPRLEPGSGKVEMVRVAREVESTDWIRGERVSNPAQGPPAHPVGPMRVGIRWRGEMDLDLYARPREGMERLYFEHPRSPEGYYYKDHRSSPDREYEFIEFTEPVDVREVEVAVNYYAARGSGGEPASGEVRVEYEGRIYSGRFELEAREGNRGREGRGQAAWWCRIDVPRLLRLR